MWWMLWMACATRAPVVPVVVAEIFDVPPPPGHRTVQVSGLPAEGLVLGALVPLGSPAGAPIATGDLVDIEGQALTFYVPEAQTDALLDAPALVILP